MKNNVSNKERIGDILDAISKVEITLEGVELEVYLLDFRKKLIIERLFEIIGEAANHIDNEVKLKYSKIPWGKMIGTRNFISHEYVRINHRLLYAVSVEELSIIKPILEEIYKNIQ